MSHDSGSILSRTDSRIKLAAALAALLLTASASNPWTLLLGFVIVVALAPKRSTATAFRRTWHFLAAAAAAVLLTRGWTGASSAAAVLLKTSTSIAVVAWLLATCSTKELLTASEQLGAPRTFIAATVLAVRYLGVLQEESQRMRRAQAARSVHLHRWMHWRIQANSVGALFLRSLERGERVHQAMICRGWSGELRWLPDEGATAVAAGQSRAGGASDWPSSKSEI